MGTCKVSEPESVAHARADRPNMARRAPVKRDVFFLWTTRGEFMRYLATTSDVLHRNCMYVSFRTLCTSVQLKNMYTSGHLPHCAATPSSANLTRTQRHQTNLQNRLQ